MSDPHFQITGTSYTGTAGFLTAGLVFAPAVLAVSYPFSNLVLSLVLLSALTCLGFAWHRWSHASQLSIPTIGIDDAVRQRWGRFTLHPVRLVGALPARLQSVVVKGKRS